MIIPKVYMSPIPTSQPLNTTVLFNSVQSLTAAQQAQARRNIGMPLDILQLGAVADAETDIAYFVNLALSISSHVIIPEGTYASAGTITVGAGQILEGLGKVIIKHRPADDTTDCIVLSGSTKWGAFVRNIEVVGLDGVANGRDLVRVSYGDYNRLERVHARFAKRDAFHYEPDGSSKWIENLFVLDCKANAPGRDGHHLYVPDNTSVFINQAIFQNCETRSVARHALYIGNGNTAAQSNKIGGFSWINGELAASGAVADALVKLETTSIGAIENIRLMDVAIEDTAATRTGAALEVVGSAFIGKLTIDQVVTYGTAQTYVGYENFTLFEIQEPLIARGHQHIEAFAGYTWKVRTSTIAQGVATDVRATVDGEIWEVYVLNRYNNASWYARATVIGSTVIQLGGNLVTLSVSAGMLQVTNTSATSAALEIFIQRVLKDANT